MTDPANPTPPLTRPRWSFYDITVLLTVPVVLLAALTWGIVYVLNQPIDSTRCASHLVEIGKALKTYADDNEGFYPPSPVELFPRWCTQECVFDCPSIICPRGKVYSWEDTRESMVALREDTARSYRYVSYPTNTAKAVLARLPIVFDKSTNHPGMSVNVLFGDGHVKWEKRPEFIAKLRNMASNEKLPVSCREVLKQTLKTVEEEVQK